MSATLLNQGEGLGKKILPAHPNYRLALVYLLGEAQSNPDGEFFLGKQIALNIKTMGQTLRSLDRQDAERIIITGSMTYNAHLGILSKQGFIPHARFNTGELSLLPGMDGLAVADAETLASMNSYQGLVQVLYNGQAHRDIVSHVGELFWDDKGAALRLLNKP